VKYLQGGNVVRLVPDEVVVGERLRRVSAVQVQNLIAMAEDTGLTTPIHVRRVEGRHELIDGAHRLAAAKSMGLPDIAALVVECRQDEARAMEASNNLGAARMSPLQTAVFVASWKRDYYRLHPDRKPGLFHGNQHTGKVVTDKMSVTTTEGKSKGSKDALATAMAASLATSERTVFRILAVGERLTPDEVAVLDAPDIHVGLSDLAALAKISEPDERAQVVLKLAARKGRGTARARAEYRAEKGEGPRPKNKVETGFIALSKAWASAPLAARKHFLLEYRAEIWEAQNKGAPLARWSEASDE
jgi:ParB family chromosome partitioning protein